MVLATWLGVAAPLWAASDIIVPSSGYQATDRLASMDPGNYDVFGDMVAVYTSSHLKVYDRNTWEEVYDLGDANYGTTYNSFVTFDPSGESLWVGYTVGGNADDRIYQITNLGGTPAWNHAATLAANYELAFSGTTAYVSGLNSTTWGGPNAIWQLNTTGGDHTLVAEVGGFASGMAFDAAGGLYYGTNFGSDNKLVKFTAEQVGEGGKTIADAETLTALPYDCADVEIDDAGHVLLAVNEIDTSWNQLSSTLAMWNGTVGDGDNYDVIGTQGADHWYTVVRAMGDITTDGVAYLDDGGAWGQPVLGLAEIRPVSTPEPSSFLLAASGLLMFAWGWWRRHRS